MFLRLLILVIFGHLLSLGESLETQSEHRSDGASKDHLLDEYFSTKTTRPEADTTPENRSSITTTPITPAPPRVKLIIKEDQVAVDHDLEMDCEVVSYPAAKVVKWYTNDTAVHNANGIELLNKGKTLRIRHAQYVHTGNYKCIAANEYGIGKDNKNIKVVAPVPLKVKILAHNEKFVEGGSILLVCHVCGLPKANQVRWYKHGYRIFETDRIRMSNGNQTLEITSASPNDVAIYTCEAFHDYQVDGNSKYITLSQTPNFGPGDTDAVLQPMRVQIASKLDEEFHFLRLCCNVTDYHYDNIVNWYKDDRPILKTRRIKFFNDNGCLDIMDPVENDSGRYSCVGGNERGRDIAAEYVRIPWKIQPLAVRPITLHSTMQPGGAITIICNISGYPQYDEILWFYKSEPQRETDRAQFSPDRTRLFLSDLVIGDGGEYSCEASNEFGGDLGTKELSFY